MEVAEKRNHIKLKDETIEYLSFLGKSSKRIDNLCYYDGRAMDKEFRVITQLLTEYYSKNKINEETLKFLFSRLLDNYFSCKTEKLVLDKLSKIYGKEEG